MNKIVAFDQNDTPRDQSGLNSQYFLEQHVLRAVKETFELRLILIAISISAVIMRKTMSIGF